MGTNTNISEIPKKFKLLKNETIYNIQTVDHDRPKTNLSSITEILRLTSSSKEPEIGNNGPSIAALPSELLPENRLGQRLYSVIFGRDSLRVAIDLVDKYPKLAATTIQTLAELQGINYDIPSEEEPGRIPHEIRSTSDPIAMRLTKEFGWGWPYYGSIDATPEFIRTLSAYCRLSPNNLDFLNQTYIDKASQNQTIKHALFSAVDWMIRRMNSNPEGLLEYKSATPHGIENQVWKDSWDAYHHSDGTIANHKQGIASIEIQTVSYDTLIDAAELYDTNVINKPEEAKLLRQQAEKLYNNILKIFWTDDKGGYFIIGTDRDDTGKVRQLKIRTSNMGHIFNSYITDKKDDEMTKKMLTTLKQLQSPELLSVSGIRTLANDELRFREGAYHNGSVWIWDTHYIAKGARRHTKSHPELGLFADDLESRINNVIQTIGEFPEYVRGGDQIAINTQIIDVFDKEHNRINHVEQPPQDVQAWTVSAVIAAQ